jgi:hypothetical protein
LTGTSNDIVSYQDAGGLWRMGHEFRGGFLKEIARASDTPAHLSVTEHENGLEVTCTLELDGEAIRRRMWFNQASPRIYFRIEGRAPEGRTLTVRFATALATQQIIMDMPGGVISRPPKKIYDPTFWPLQHFMHIQEDGDQGAGVALWLSQPGAVAYEPGQYFETVALRNATRERAFGFLTIPGMPATGHERESHTLDYALQFTTGGDQRGIIQFAHKPTWPWDSAEDIALQQWADAVITTDNPNVFVTAAKPASRWAEASPDGGIIVRLLAPYPPQDPIKVRIRDCAIKTAYLCDARERNLHPLAVQADPTHSGTICSLTMPGAIATLRLLT